ncbi:MAG: ABC transporter substrate-binding protein [Deltaproteobacteria bacterium]|nr:ABC transporter substrate-binding protein [Deltaproteobacteria bacterium]
MRTSRGAAIWSEKSGRWVGALVWIAVGGLGLGLAFPAPAPAQEPIRIGVVVDITGPASSLGIPERNTALLLQEELEARRGIRGQPVRLVIYDGESNETKTLLAVKRAIEEDRAAVVICCTQSGTTLAVVDTAQKARVPLISLAASIKIVEPVKDRHWVFKTPQSDVLVAEVLLDYLQQQQRVTRIAWMNVDNAFGDSGRVEFERAARRRGVRIATSERFGDKDVDMTAQLTRVAGTDAQAVVVWAIPPAASIITKNARELALKIPVFQSHGVGNKAFIDLAGPASHGIRFPAGKLLVAEQLPDSDPQKPVLLAYARAYEARFGPRNTFGGHAWDGLKIAFQTLDTVLGRGRPADLAQLRARIRDEIERVKEFVGISGIFSFSPTEHNGLDRRALVMIEIDQGKWKAAR